MIAPTPSATTNALTLGKGTLASRGMGFVRDALVAALLGGGWMADALLVAFRLPNLARSLLADGAFAYALVPSFHRLRTLDPERAWRFVRTMTLSLLLFFGLFVLAGVLFPDNIAIVLAPGFHGAPAILDKASSFMVLCLVSLPLVSGAAVSASALMAQGIFRPPAFASAVFNVVVIASAGLAFLFFGTGGEGVPYMLCGGVIAAGAVQWAHQTFHLRRLGYRSVGPMDFSDPVFAKSLRALPRSVFGVGGHQANLLLATFLASFLAEGSISALYFAERLIGFPLGIIGASMGLAALSDLSGIAQTFRGKTGEGRQDVIAASKKLFADHLVKASRVTLFFALPAAVGTACLAQPLTSVLFGHGQFDHDALMRTCNALLAYLIGLPALALIRPLLAALGALGKTKEAMQGAFAGLGAVVLLGSASLLAGAPWGPALAVSLAAWANAAVLIRALLQKGYSPLPGLAWPIKLLAASAIMAACVVATADLFTSNLAKAATVPLGIAVYFAAAFVLRLEEGKTVYAVLMGMVWKKRKIP